MAVFKAIKNPSTKKGGLSPSGAVVSTPPAGRGEVRIRGEEQGRDKCLGTGAKSCLTEL